jgi:hypothetical protein
VLSLKIEPSLVTASWQQNLSAVLISSTLIGLEYYGFTEFRPALASVYIVCLTRVMIQPTFTIRGVISILALFEVSPMGMRSKMGSV